jgi:hypothetical protein
MTMQEHHHMWIKKKCVFRQEGVIVYKRTSYSSNTNCHETFIHSGGYVWKTI